MSSAGVQQVQLSDASREVESITQRVRLPCGARGSSIYHLHIRCRGTRNASDE